jgi:5'-AMP-activated protein kinase catalytic alpha subunit
MGVILYALLCGTLPFDDESIPNLFKKIKSGMYSLPAHLSQLSRDLILRMLVVDPMKRITIPEIRQHPWFMHKLPSYLNLAPEMIESQERYVDDEIVAKVCQLNIKGVTAEAVIDAVMRKTEDSTARLLGQLRPGHQQRHEMRVAYELLLDAKRHKLRIADVVLAQQSSGQTPPAANSPLRLSLGSSTPPSGNKIDMTRAAGAAAASSQTQLGVQPARRRRWYLGIQSKKDPAHVMTEVYKAMFALDCLWHQVNNYRVLCLWKNGGDAQQQPVYQDPITSSGLELAGDFMGAENMEMDHSHSQSHSQTHSSPPPDKALGPSDVKIALSLYKVQQNIFLLDFQRIEVVLHRSISLCMHVSNTYCM